MKPKELTQRIETEFNAKWELEKGELAEELARLASRHVSMGLPRSSSHVAAIAKAHSHSLSDASSLFLATARKVIAAEGIERTSRLSEAVGDSYREVMQIICHGFNKEIKEHAARLGFGNQSPTLKATLQGILIGSCTELAAVFPKASDPKPAEARGDDQKDPNHEDSEMPKVFISHSSNDVELARALVDLLRTSLNLRSAEIRCTSVEGYKLLGGADTDETIRDELLTAPLFVGLISDASFESAYVLFELGARWGARKHLVPLLAPGVEPSVLKGPIAGLNALRCDSSGQLHQFIKEAADHIGAEAEPAASYNAQLEILTGWEPRSQHLQGPSNEDQLRLFRSEFAKFLRRLKVELQVERDTDPNWIEDAQLVFYSYQSDLVDFRSAIVNDNESPLATLLDSALVEVKALQRKDQIMDGGLWAAEFWERTDVLITSLGRILEILDEQL